LIDRDPTVNPITPGPTSDAGDLATPADLGEDGHEDKSDDEPDGEIDEELAAELDMVLGDQGQERDDDEEEDEDDEDDSDEEEEDEDDETSQSMKLLNEEIRDLTAAVAKKEHEIASSSNPLIKVWAPFHLPTTNSSRSSQRRFEDALRKLKADLEMKTAQSDEAKERLRLQREGISPEDAERGPSVEQEDNEDDLFGDNGQDDMMEIG
jgi:transcription initiation factor TFIID subunit 7